MIVSFETHHNQFIEVLLATCQTFVNDSLIKVFPHQTFALYNMLHS